MHTWGSPTTSSIELAHRSTNRAFSLVELIISMGLASFILTAVLTTFLMIGRISKNIQNYTEIEAKARKSLETMSREIRLAFAVTSYSTTSFSISIPDSTSTVPDTTSGSAPLYNQSSASGAYSVTYSFDSTNHIITRTGPPIFNPTGTSTTETFISNVYQIPNLSNNDVFNYYHRYVAATSVTDPGGVGYANGYETNTATSTTEIQQIEVKFLVKESAATVKDATNKVLSARFILRNKM
jgi:Tfp pilus assembly protein PilW